MFRIVRVTHLLTPYFSYFRTLQYSTANKGHCFVVATNFLRNYVTVVVIFLGELYLFSPKNGFGTLA